MSLRVVRIYCSVFVMLLTLATGAAHASPLLVAAQRDGSLVTLDPLTGGITSTIGSLGTVRVTGLAFDPLTGVLFGNTGGLGSVLDSLVTMKEEVVIDPMIAAQARRSVERMIHLKS